MASEVRHAYWQSGALPSDVRMGYAALGPLAASPLDYIPATPSYLKKDVGGPPGPSGAGAYNMGSIRYATGGGGPPSATLVNPGLMSAPNLSGGRVASASMSRGPMNTSVGSVRYR
jgi:hypothetical protein